MWKVSARTMCAVIWRDRRTSKQAIELERQIAQKKKTKEKKNQNQKPAAVFSSSKFKEQFLHEEQQQQQLLKFRSAIGR